MAKPKLPPKQSYDVEWEDTDGDINVLTVWARRAGEAQQIAEQRLKDNPKFKRIENVELYP
jgi:hypothetical protein